MKEKAYSGNISIHTQNMDTQNIVDDYIPVMGNDFTYQKVHK